MGPQGELPPGAVMMQMLMGRWVAQTIGAVAELGVPDAMGDAPRPVAELAKDTGLNAGALERVLRLLAMAGVVAEASPHAYVLTPLGRTLRSDAPESLRDIAIFFGTELHVRAWSRLSHSLKTGLPALPEITGTPGFEFLRRNPDMAAVFDRAMTSLSRQESAAVVQAYDLSGIGRLADVGGGHGFFLGSLLAAHPAMQGALFDLPPVVAGAPALLQQLGVADRVEIHGGSFFEDALPKADAIALKHIIHDWSDEASVKILRACHAALPAGGKCLLVEIVLPPGAIPHIGRLLDIEMLVATDGGRERTEAEYAGLLEQAGFRLARVVPTRAPASVIEAIKV